ncbi:MULTISPECIES: hypothetical protein [Bradyrhizobium]|uniref:hypothetical protein n=1 Tax=Bradyrhizobium TaxID=374 RepID=UPI0013E8F47B|nr:MULTISPECIES: hypothetical protein [Bradyrhizobium]UQR64673.1 hypothetical protein LRP30_05040 [Bradyrhizobium sp. C-145]
MEPLVCISWPGVLLDTPWAKTAGAVPMRAMAESATIILFIFIPPSEGSTVINGLETAPFHERLFINLLSRVHQMPDVRVAPIRRSSTGDPDD